MNTALARAERVVVAPIGLDAMSDVDFNRLSEIVQTTLGIKMPLSKKTMIQARLSRRLRALGIESFHAYCRYLLESPEASEEMVHFLDLATTNKTAFFREEDHYRFLQSEGLASLLRLGPVATRRRVEMWSAGCSSGEEPHTLAMVTSEWMLSNAPGWSFGVLGTDVSTRVLEAARLGVYPESAVDPVPAALRQKYLMKSKNREERLVRVVPILRGHVRYRQVNFMDDDYRVHEPMAVIFFRNVMIYFDRPTQEAVVRKLCRSLIPGGYFMCSLAESLQGMDVPLEPVGRSVFRRA